MEGLSSSKLWQIFDASAQIVGELPSPFLGLWENQLRLICWSRVKKRGREPQEWLAEQSRSRQLFVRQLPGSTSRMENGGSLSACDACHGESC